MYRPIDQTKTGMKLKKMLETAGYSVKDIQKYLHLTCPQSIYRWFKGKILPSVDHLYALSRLLNVHMEDLLVMQGENIVYGFGLSGDSAIKRLLVYEKCLRNTA